MKKILSKITFILLSSMAYMFLLHRVLYRIFPPQKIFLSKNFEKGSLMVGSLAFLCYFVYLIKTTEFCLPWYEWSLNQKKIKDFAKKHKQEYKKKAKANKNIDVGTNKDTLRYYKILGINENATNKKMKKAYWKKVKKCHPDTNPNDKKAEAKFREVVEAYEVLKIIRRKK